MSRSTGSFRRGVAPPPPYTPKGSVALQYHRNVYLSVVIPVSFFLLAVLLGLSPLGGVLDYTFAPIAVGLALLLLLKQPNAYLSFIMWLWMLSPFVRRLSDWHSSFHSISVVMIAPLASTALAAITPLRFYKRTADRRSLPYLFYLAILFYGFVIGAPNVGIPSAAYALAGWAVPVIFAIHLQITPGKAKEKGDAILRALTFGTLVIGLYGIFQYILMPPWDAAWMIGSEMESIGRPSPFEVRVFSTLNSPAPFGAFVAAGVIVAIATRNNFRVAAIGLGGMGLLLSLVRTAWGSCLVGMICLFSFSSWRQRLRLLVLVAVCATLVTPIVAFTPLGGTIVTRFASLRDTENDISLAERTMLYRKLSGRVLTSIVGAGLGQTGDSTRLSSSTIEISSIDSGVLEAFYTFGLLASLLLGSIVVMVIAAWPRFTSPMAIVLVSVAVSGVPVLFFGNPLVGAPGMLFFPFLALARLLQDDGGNRARGRVVTGLYRVRR